MTFGSVKVARGALGFQIDGIDSNGLLLEVPEEWPRLVVEHRLGSGAGAPFESREDFVRTPLVIGGEMTVARGENLVRLVTQRPLPPGDLLQPCVSHAAAVHSRWLGRAALHGGAIAFDGSALALLGAKHAGKSSLVAWLAHFTPATALTDDVVVVGDGELYSGPRAVDLRLPVAEPFTDLAGKPARGGERLRLALPPCPPVLRFHGFVELAWGSVLNLEPIAPAERLAVLARHSAYAWLPGGPVGLLDLAGAPMSRLTRPRSWSSLPAVADLLAAAVG